MPLAFTGGTTHNCTPKEFCRLQALLPPLTCHTPRVTFQPDAFNPQSRNPAHWQSLMHPAAGSLPILPPSLIGYHTIPSPLGRFCIHTKSILSFATLYFFSCSGQGIRGLLHLLLVWHCLILGYVRQHPGIRVLNSTFSVVRFPDVIPITVPPINELLAVH